MIEVENVTKVFDTFRAVDGISFSIATGEIVGLLGPNGAGKTTTMRMIAGYYVPDGGRVLVDGIDVTERPVETKRKIGYMCENAPMYADMIVYDYLRYVAAIEGADADERIPLLADVCGLRDIMSKNINELSRGNKQRVGLAHALMGDAEILILDEPTSGLDPNQVQDVRALIREIGKTRTVIISTHILSEAETLCDRIIIISGGKKVADSPTGELREHFGGGAEVILSVGGADSAELERALLSAPGAESVSCEAGADGAMSARVSVGKGSEVRPELARICVERGWQLYSLELRRNSLEDVFTALTHDSGAPAEPGAEDASGAAAQEAKDE